MSESISDLYLLESVKSFKGLKSNAEKAIAQISDAQIKEQPDEESNSVAVIVKHVAGNMRSRFTDFMSSDGEKVDRNRDGEFIDSYASRESMMNDWESGWKCLFDALDSLTGDDLDKTVYIRNEPHTVLRAIHRQLTHYAYHCGQIVFLCKHLQKNKFRSLSIPRGESLKYVNEPPKNN
jgi:hypothetical protein